MPSTTKSAPATTKRRTAAQVADVMREVKGRDTAPERAFRSALHRRGLRFRVCDSNLPGKPDIVFPGPKLAIFIDGDFWHGHQWRLRGLRSLDEQLETVNNPEYWKRKIERNIHRDFANTAKLLDDGWRVLRFWESDLACGLESCVELVASALNESESAATNSAHRAEDGGCSFAYESLAYRSVGEFFAGIGLVRLGLESAGWRASFANDIDPDKLAMYRDNFGDSDFTLGDIHDLRVSDLPRAALFTASFPCNDLSVAGGRAGLAGRNSSAFWGVIRLLRESGNRRPPIVMFENVPGFLKSHGGRDLVRALVAMNELGYACDLFVMNALNFTPQSRPRLFIVASPAVGAAPEITDESLRGRSPDVIDFIRRSDGVRWSVRPLPDPPEPRRRIDDILENLAEDDPHWWNERRSEYLLNQMSPRHRAHADQMIKSANDSHATVFRRVRNGKSMAELRADGVAGCLRTPRGGSGRQILFTAGRGRYRTRLLTARECARLQGAPDSFIINASLNKALFGFGDAVCVPVIRWIGDHYLTPLAAELLRGRALAP